MREKDHGYPGRNRNPSAFSNPDVFDIACPIRQHLAFGASVHVCVGSRLAEMQLRLAFAEMARHVRHIKIVGPPSRVRSNFINGFKRLDVRLIA